MMKAITTLILLISLCACGQTPASDLNTGPYAEIALDFSIPATPMAAETLEHVRAILAEQDIAVEVKAYYSGWETFYDLSWLQYWDDSTVYIGIRPDDYLVEYADGSYGPFNGCYHWQGVSLAAINYRSVDPQSLATLILHEVAHSCGWNHEDPDRFEFLRNCFYGE